MRVVTSVLMALLLAIPAPDAIRAVDFRDLLTRKLGTVRQCPAEPVVLSLDVEYADLTDDRRDEAIVNAATCRGGGERDFTGVYTMSWKGEPIPLEVSIGDRDRHDLFAGSNETPRLEAVKGNLVQSYVIGVTNRSWARHKTGWTRTITYRWTGEAFLIDTIDDQPPQSEGENE